MSLVSVDLLEPNKWNPNVMQDLEYQALKEDMKLRGPRGIDPILASIKSVFYSTGPVASKDFDGEGRLVIVDGEHRWRAAKELGWKEVLCAVEAIQEDEAKGICYRKNRERGTIDPFKEAALFKSEVESKRSQKEIAEKYLITPSTVSHRLSLLNLSASIMSVVVKLPRGTITPSHLEPIATLEPEDQKKVELKYPYGDGFKSVKDIESEVAGIKEERAEEKALAEAIKTAAFPKCPRCKDAATGIHYKKLPWVTCERGHEWNLKTGKGLYEEHTIEQRGLGGETVAKTPSSVLRSEHSVKDLARVFGERIKEIVPKMDSVTSISVSGSLENARYSFDLRFYGRTMNVHVSHGGNDRGFFAEEHEYRSGEKSAVHCGRPQDIENVKGFIDAAFQGKVGVEPKKRKKEGPR